MYCGQCGKKVMDNMLFCPFCGAPIVIPDQDAPAASASESGAEPPVQRPEPAQEMEAKPAEQCAQTAVQSAPEAPVSLFDAADRPASKQPKQVPKEEFEPLRFDFDAPDEEDAPAPESEAEPESAVEDIPEPPAPPKRRSAPTRPENHRSRSANTYIPVKDMDLDDIFMDGGDEDDAYDVDEDYGDPYEDDFDYEEPESGSFFQRHIRGIVALILMLILLVVCAAWGISPRGQRVLAQVNLAWSAEAYADLGYEAYQKDSDLLAARYYEKALNRDPENYEYAHSAMVAYYEADKLENAAAMLKKCVDLDPDNPEPYEELLILYPDAQTRPWDISELVRMGYQRTGAQSLKQE